MTAQKKPTFEKNGYEIHNGCRIRRIELFSGISYYHVTLQRLSGNHLQKRFITAEQAREFAKNAAQLNADDAMPPLSLLSPERIDAAKAFIMDLMHAGLQKAGELRAYRDDLTYDVETLVDEFIAEKQVRTERGEQPIKAFVSTKKALHRFSEKFGDRSAHTVTASELNHFLDGVNDLASRRSLRLQISAFFNWAVTQERLPCNPIGPTFKKDGFEIKNGSRIQRMEIMDGFYYYRVTLQKISGNHIRRGFMTAKRARSFAGKITDETTEEGARALRLIHSTRIDSVKASILELIDTNQRKAA